MTETLPPFNVAALRWLAQCRPQIKAAIAQGDGDRLAAMVVQGETLLDQRYIQEEAWTQIMIAGDDALAKRWWDACPPVFLAHPETSEANSRSTLYDQALTVAAHHGRTLWVDRLVEVMADRHRYIATVHDQLEPGEAGSHAYRTALRGAWAGGQAALLTHLVHGMPDAVRAHLLDQAWKGEDGELFEALVTHLPQPLPDAQWQAWGDRFPTRRHDPASPDDPAECRSYLALVRACLPHLSVDQLLRQLAHLQAGVSDVPGLWGLLTQACVLPERRPAVREALAWAPVPLPSLEAALTAADREAALAQQPAATGPRSRHRA